MAEKPSNTALIGGLVLAGIGAVVIFIATRPVEGENGITPVCNEGQRSTRTCPDAIHSITTRTCVGGQWVDTGQVCPEPPLPGEPETGIYQPLLGGLTIVIDIDPDLVNRGTPDYILVARIAVKPPEFGGWSMWLEFFNGKRGIVITPTINSTLAFADDLPSISDLEQFLTDLHTTGEINVTQWNNALSQIQTYLVQGGV